MQCVNRDSCLKFNQLQKPRDNILVKKNQVEKENLAKSQWTKKDKLEWKSSVIFQDTSSAIIKKRNKI